MHAHIENEGQLSLVHVSLTKEPLYYFDNMYLKTKASIFYVHSIYIGLNTMRWSWAKWVGVSLCFQYSEVGDNSLIL